jgi:hypothetical protein
MPQSPLRLIEKCAEYVPQAEYTDVPSGLRGIYVLYDCRDNEKKHYDVVYVGMACAGRRGGIRSRLRRHRNSKRKGPRWTHFSLFKVWDNIRDEEVAELEGLFRHIYRDDSRANKLNIQRGFKKLREIRENSLTKWLESRAT